MTPTEAANTWILKKIELDHTSLIDRDVFCASVEYAREACKEEAARTAVADEFYSAVYAHPSKASIGL